MADTGQTFTYTARKGRFWTAALPFLSLALIETGVAALVIVLLAHGTLRIALLAGWGAIFPLMAWLLTRPLRTRHRLTSTHLTLRFGPTRLEIPLGEIATARPVRMPLGMVQPLRAEVEPRKRRLVAAFAEEGQVLLTLAEPRHVAAGRRSGEVSEILINVDRREELLATLGISSKTSSPTSSPAPGPPFRLHAAPDASPAPARAFAGPPAIALEGVVRSFGSLRAVDGLELRVDRGEVYGFLGANGAGKTTTIQMMVGLLAPDTGRVSIAGHDLAAEPLAARAAFGYVPDRPLLYDRLTGREFLQFIAQLRRLPGPPAAARVGELLAAVDLATAADRLCGTYSLGMKRKLSLAAALLHRPAVLILDEPFNGLDPKGARRLKDLLSRLAAEGAGVFLSTHDLATAEAVCHRVGILHRGRLVAEGSAAELRARVTGGATDLEAAFLEITEEAPQPAIEVAAV
ncbi:MAG TPA: ATP-binding cassette domain-containing protein [Thermoanaerobaculia bacterium]|jgi:ABC-2 type transport system ATP-binding protein|nr:ATP-binding cassette domain-containing protein [Thermoanaerobaculia bacterium]